MRLIVTYALSRIVSEIQRREVENHPFLVWAHDQKDPFEFRRQTSPAKR